MLNLNGSTDKIQLVLAGAVATNELSWQASWAQLATTDLEKYDTSEGLSNGATDVDMVAGVAAKQMLVKSLTVHNRDTVAASVTVQKDVSGANYPLIRCTLQASETLHYEDGAGWTTRDAYGRSIVETEVTYRELQSFTTPGSAVWVKPTTFTPVWVDVVCIGAGGGGGGGGSFTGAFRRMGGSGGGGGAYNRKTFRAADLPASVLMQIGQGGGGGTGGASGAVGVDGNSGEISAFGGPIQPFSATTPVFAAQCWLQAGGGNGGRLGAITTAAGSGGGGGGTASCGSVGSATQGLGGYPYASTVTPVVGGQGAQGQTTDGICAEYGGAGGGGHSNVPANYSGGSSIHGGGGGGCGGGANATPTVIGPTAGGANNSYTAGGGGAAGVSGAVPTVGADGSTFSICAGSGGGGGGSTVDANTDGARGGDGGIGGGGGGGGSGSNTGLGGDGGTGGKGAIYVFTW